MQTVVILGTGGTIAGLNDDPARAWHYRAAQLPVSRLIGAIPALADVPLEAEQVAQIDSKDMSWAVWRELGHALERHLNRPEVAGVVITHGTDTLEETAYLLHRLCDHGKPVVLTAAMRPATAPDADGPGNLRDAVHVVQEAAKRRLGGVVAVLHGRIWHGALVRKAWSNALDAFDGGGARPIACVDPQGRWTKDDDLLGRWPCPGQGGPLASPEKAQLAGAPSEQPMSANGLTLALLDQPPPRVEIVTSHADADGWLVDAALHHAARQGVALSGLIIAGTGHGTVHEGLEAALRRAVQAGVVVWLSTRVARGGVQAREGDAWPACGTLTPAQARIALMLHLLDA